VIGGREVVAGGRWSAKKGSQPETIMPKSTGLSEMNWV
jgi:hypothetical protein